VLHEKIAKYTLLTSAQLLLEAQYFKMSKEDGDSFHISKNRLSSKRNHLSSSKVLESETLEKFSEAGNVLRRFELCFGRQQVALLVKTFVRNCLRAFVRDGY